MAVDTARPVAVDTARPVCPLFETIATFFFLAAAIILRNGRLVLHRRSMLRWWRGRGSKSILVLGLGVVLQYYTMRGAFVRPIKRPPPATAAMSAPVLPNSPLASAAR